jgi:glycosyltransferase involved in cell wall biosynthesis
MKLSVLISVYDKESPVFFDQCLESLAQQTLSADEVVIVEDGPLGEELRSTIDGWRTMLPIVSLRMPAHVGLGAALRAGLYACEGEYIARMDSDDICVPERFERQVTYLDANREVDVVGAAIAEFQQNPSAPQTIRRLPASGDALRRFARSRTPMNHMTVVFRKSSVVAAGNYESCQGFEDYHLWARMLTLGYQLRNLKDVLVFARCGNGMQGRRGGLAYLKREIRFQSFLRRMGLLDMAGSVWNILIRGSVRLAPDSIRALLYRSLLRTRPVAVLRTMH